MSTFDRVMHILGVTAGTIAVLGATGGVAIPAWLTIVAAGVQTAAQLSTSSAVKNSMFTPKPDARGQIQDKEDPK